MATRYAFISEWLDPQSGILWKHQCLFYPDTQEIEMIDIKNRRHFLKKVRQEDITLDRLYIGSIMTVFSRQIKLVEYGDEFTRSRLESRTQRTLAMVKPDGIPHLGAIVNAICRSGLQISNMKMCKLSKAEAQQFYEVHAGRPFFDKLTDFMSSGRIVAMELVAADAIAKWRALIGPTDSNVARQTAPDSLRAHFGTDNTCNACHGSDAPETAAQELSFFFGQSGVGRCDLGSRTTLAIIKPHVLKEGTAGLVLDCILEHFAATALQMFRLDKAAAAEFYEVYKGVVAPGEFSGMVEELTSGPCIAVEIADRDGGDPLEGFRELCGPADPDIGRVLRSKSIRAQFGVTKVLNAVHCTDLPEDGPLEVNYFFSILQK